MEDEGKMRMEGWGGRWDSRGRGRDKMRRNGFREEEQAWLYSEQCHI